MDSDRLDEAYRIVKHGHMSLGTILEMLNIEVSPDEMLELRDEMNSYLIVLGIMES